MWCQVMPKSIKYRFVVFLLSNHFKGKDLIARILNYGIWRKACDMNRLSPFGNYPRNDMIYQLWLFGTVAPCVWHYQRRCFVLTFEWLRERHYCVYFWIDFVGTETLVNSARHNDSLCPFLFEHKCHCTVAGRRFSLILWGPSHYLHFSLEPRCLGTVIISSVRQADGLVVKLSFTLCTQNVKLTQYIACTNNLSTVTLCGR